MSDSLRRIVIWGFALVGLLGLLAIIFLAAMVWRFEGGRGRDPAPIEAKTPGERFAVADTNALPGDAVIEIVIATEASVPTGGNPYSSGRGEIDERNVVLMDKSNGANRRLLTDNAHQISLRRYLPASAEAKEQSPGDYAIEVDADGKSRTVVPPAAYYVVAVRSADRKSQDVLLGDLKSGRQAFVLTGIDGVDRIWMQSPTRVAMLMRQGRKLFFRAYEMPDLKLVASQPVEIG